MENSRQGEPNGKNNSPEFTEGYPDYAVNVLEPLVRRIAEGNAIVYVGAGVSQSAGLPSWSELLKKLQKETEGRLRNQNKVAIDYFENLKDKSRSLEVGDWLLRLLGPEFQHIISVSLSEGADLCQIEPSTIHANLVRLPFSMAITTNYDLLLETAYEKAYRVCPQKLPYLTWRHTEEILRASNRKPFRIVHAHGSVGDSNSIVLSGSQYTMLHNAQPRFGEVLKGLLKNKTFLFVGAGLEDPDLIFQLQEAIAENAGAVGPHYALLPYLEAPQMRRDILRESLHIEVVPVGSSAYAERLSREGKKDWITPASSAILQALAGRVALRRFDSALPGFPTSDDSMFCLNIALRNLLKHAIEFTGSSRGDFCLSRDGIDSHLSGELFYDIAEGANGPELAGYKVEADSICGVAYYQSTTEYGVYVGNVNVKDLAKEIASRSRLRHYGGIKYVRGDNNVQSELALPIEADGVRVGVLNLDSSLEAAYGENHLENDDYLRVAKRFAEKAGRLYAAAHERNRRGARLKAEEIEKDYGEMRKICVRLWRIARGLEPPKEGDSQQLEFLIYRADYRKGELVSQNPMTTVLKSKPELGEKVPVQCFPFHSEKNKNCYLSTRVFLDGRPYYYPDVIQATIDGKIRNKHTNELGLTRHREDEQQGSEEREPIIGFPILIHGLVAGVFVAWHYRSADLNRGDFELDELDGRDIELLRRTSHLMANYFRWKEEDGEGLGQISSRSIPEIAPSNDIVPESNDPVSIKKVKQVLDCITKSKSEELFGESQDLNSVGVFYRDAIGPAVYGFLTLLNENESKFREAMLKRNQRQPTDWVSPTRCRCWVKNKPLFGRKEIEKPIFLLAFQLELIAAEKNRTTEQWKNLYRIDGMDNVGIATRPFGSLQTTSSIGTDDNRQETVSAAYSAREDTLDGARTANIHSISVDSFDGTTWHPEEIKVSIFDDDRHLSFLLSRISSYPFAFQQRPRQIGCDMMANVLEKDTNLPWFVAPLIVGSEMQWREEGKPEDKGASDHINPNAESQLVGYLTFDGKIQPESVPASDRIETKDDWAKFQNDLLHQMALFGACLAHHKCFENLVSLNS